MFFWIAAACSFLGLLVTVWLVSRAAIEGDADFLLGAFPATLLTGLISLFVIVPWEGLASDLADLRHSQHLVAVYSERVESLESRLDAFDYSASAMWNKDSPVASIVEALSEAESNLAEAKTIKAKARISIEARANGPMSGIVTILGKE